MPIPLLVTGGDFAGSGFDNLISLTLADAIVGVRENHWAAKATIAALLSEAHRTSGSAGEAAAAQQRASFCLARAEEARIHAFVETDAAVPGDAAGDRA